MYQLIFGKKFLDSVKILDKTLKPKLKFSLDFLLLNPFYSSLHTKPLTGKLSGFYSFRLSRDYRVIFKIISFEKIYLISIGHRKDVYR